MELRGDFRVRTGEQDPGAFGQDTAEAAPAAVDLCSPAALAAGVVQPRSSSARAADRPSLLVAADQRPNHPAARALGGAATDMLVAAGANRSGGPFRLDRAGAPAPETRPGRTCPAGAADRAARGNPLAGPGFLADRADRHRALVAAVAQVGSGRRRACRDLAGPSTASARPLRSLVARGADWAVIGGPGNGALLAAGRARARRALSAELAASAAVGHPGGRPAPSAASAAFRHDLLVLVIAGRADPALGAPGVDPPGPATTGACPGAATGCAGFADPAGGRLAPQAGRDLAAPGASRGRDSLIPGLDQRVRQPDQRQRICGGGGDQGAGMLLQERINLAQRPPVVRPGRGEDALGGRGVQSWHRGDQAGGDASP